MRGACLALVIALLATPAAAQQAAAPQTPSPIAKPGLIDGKPGLFVSPSEDGFEVFVTAAMHKKGVPVAIVQDQERAMFTLKAAQVETKKVSTGAKVVNCLFAYCGGNEDKANVSVQLVKDGVIVWSYSVNKGRGEKNRQSMAEAIAKHLKNHLAKHPELMAVAPQ